MRNRLLALAAATALTAGLAAPAQAQFFGGYRHHGWGWGGGWGGPGLVIGGLATGALLGAALAGPAYGYAPYGYGYPDYGYAAYGYGYPAYGYGGVYPYVSARPRVVYARPRVVYQRPRVIYRRAWSAPGYRTVGYAPRNYFTAW